MKTIQNCFGHSVKLPEERMAHILEHSKMSGMGAEIERVLTAPRTVCRSRSDGAVRLFDELHAQALGCGNDCAWS